MRILCVTPSYWPAFIFGGPVFYMHDMDKSLVAKGIDVTVYTTDAGLEGKVLLNKQVDVDGVKVTYFSHIKTFDFLTSTGWQFSPTLAVALRKNLSSFDAVYIGGVWSFSSIIAGYYCRKQNIPFVTSPMGALYPYVFKRGFWKKKMLYELFIKNNFNSANGVHYSTEDEAEKCHKSLMLKSNSFVIPLGIDLKEFSNLSDRSVLGEYYPQTKGKKVILFLSRISWKKGLDLLINAYAKLIKEYDNTHLLIVGNNEAGYESKVRTWINEFGISKNVTFTGILSGEKKMAAFSGSDVFVLPSYSENFGVAVVEAMASGLAVVISDQVGVCNDVAEYQAGFVVSCDADRLKDGVLKVLSNDALRKKMGDNAARLVRDKFSLDKMTSDIIKMFNNMAIEKNG